MFAPSVARANMILMLNAHTPLMISEIQRLSGEEHYAATKSALDTLEKLGVARRILRNDKSAYGPDTSSRHWPAARAAALVDLPYAACIEAAGLAIEEIEGLYVYGSLARGEARASSDLDLMISAPAELATDLLFALEPIGEMLGRRVDVVVWSPEEIETRLAAGDKYLRTVRDQGLRVFGPELG